ncbi:hypothetical protein FGB62_17g444 [Gracilaria domingensis]|nr:hypothetical protein FGB62_17g444 [Gracilaria domingensis]
MATPPPLSPAHTSSPHTSSSVCAVDSRPVDTMIEYLLAAMHPHHPFMPLLDAHSLPPRHHPTMSAPRPGHADLVVDSLAARADRTRASLRNCASLARMLTNNHMLAKALRPFFNAHTATAYDAVSFLYSFGVAGPTADQWHALFFASLPSHLRVEDLVVLSASAACGVTDITQPLPETVANAIFGAPGLPSSLEKVCQLYDDWLLSEHFFERVLELHISSVTESWSIHVQDDFCTVRVNDKQWNIPNELSPTVVTEVCAKIVVASVAPNVIQQMSGMISYGGRDRVLELLQRSLVQVLYAAVVHAKSIMYERILSAFGR